MKAKNNLDWINNILTHKSNKSNKNNNLNKKEEILIGKLIFV